jgi:uncharacterized membrane protein
MSEHPQGDSAAMPRRQRSRVLATLRALIRARITAGLLTVLPVLITVWIITVVFGWLRDASRWVLDSFVLSAAGRKLMLSWGIPPEDITGAGLKALPPWLQWFLTLFSIALTILLLYLIGLFAANLIGRRIIEWFDQLIARVPFIKSIYGALKQITSLFSGNSLQGFQRVALVPFPNQITRSIAFITNSFKDSITGEELVTAFIATTPNPTTGFVFIVRRSDIIEVNWPIEEAIKICISGGVLSPPDVTMVTSRRPNSE